MATTITPTPIRPQTTPIEGDSRVVLRDIGWEGYETVLRLRGERRRPRLIYLDGSLVLMSPSYRHERASERLGLFVAVVTAELDISCTPSGATTFRRRDLDKGVEGDKTFYFANEVRIRGQKDLDLNIDPPPDLAIEVEVTHPGNEALQIYAAMGVPEVWHCDEQALRVLRLGPDGTYAESPTSLALPFLTPEDIHPWLFQPRTIPESRWMRQLQTWVRDVLVPRLHATNE
jgi:Uma2 family endonuclease